MKRLSKIWMSLGLPRGKRVFSFQEFIHHLTGLTRSLPVILRTFRAARLSPQMIEKIMLSVTAVNECRYCTFVHSLQALKLGLSPEDIQKLMAFDLGACTEEEAVACAFAQHYAESNGQPDKNALLRLVGQLGFEKTRDVMVYIQMIEFGNLFGNTVDAYLPPFLRNLLI